MYYNSTDAQCYNGYILFVQVPFENVFNLFFFAYIYSTYIQYACVYVCQMWMHTAVSLSI